MPSWWRHLNKRVFNPLILRTGLRSVLIHVGRNSGKTYRTPIDAHPIDGGYVFTLVYGSGTDWVRNVLASGHARLEIGGREIDLFNPRIIGDEEAMQVLPDTVRRPPGFLNISQYLRMDLAD